MCIYLSDTCICSYYLVLEAGSLSISDVGEGFGVVWVGEQAELRSYYIGITCINILYIAIRLGSSKSTLKFYLDRYK
jgi:hypothetical protein